MLESKDNFLKLTYFWQIGPQKNISIIRRNSAVLDGKGAQ